MGGKPPGGVEEQNPRRAQRFPLSGRGGAQPRPPLRTMKMTVLRAKISSSLEQENVSRTSLPALRRANQELGISCLLGPPRGCRSASPRSLDMPNLLYPCLCPTRTKKFHAFLILSS